MELQSTSPRAFRPRLRTLVVVVVFVGLSLAVFVRQARFRAALQRERARTEAERQQAQAALDLYYSQVEAQSSDPAPQNDPPLRETLERTLKFYQGRESQASSPEQRVRILNRIQRLRAKLDELEASAGEKP